MATAIEVRMAPHHPEKRWTPPSSCSTSSSILRCSSSLRSSFCTVIFVPLQKGRGSPRGAPGPYSSSLRELDALLGEELQRAGMEGNRGVVRLLVVRRHVDGGLVGRHQVGLVLPQRLD